MLTSTFSVFSGIGRESEERLWDRGVLRWDAVSRCGDHILSAEKKRRLMQQIAEARTALDAGLADYFLNRLDGVDCVRLLHEFRNRALYIDIETTGLAASADITTVAVYDGVRVRMFVNGVNMAGFLRAVASTSVLVTYNGARFDLPRLRRCFGVSLSQPHIDLCPILGSLGYRGGLKACEARLGIRRGEESGMTGEDAVRLWKDYRETGDEGYLRTLMRYNALDVVNLERICGRLYRESMSMFPVEMPFDLPESVPVFLDEKQIFDNCIPR